VDAAGEVGGGGTAELFGDDLLMAAHGGAPG
jgi:hypothetical protein